MGLFRRSPEPARRHLIEKRERVVGGRELAELDAIASLQESRTAYEQARDLALLAERTEADARAGYYASRNEVRRIAESKIRPPDGTNAG